MAIKSRVPETVAWRWPLLLSVVLLNICLPSLVLSFGTLLYHSVSYGQTLWLGVYTSTIHLSTFYISQCWCRDAADSWGDAPGHRLMATTGLILVVASLIVCAFVPYHYQPFVYGGFGGFGSSLISAQVDYVIFDAYDSRFRIVRGICFAGQAVGQAMFPHIITALVDYYGYSMSHIVLSAIMLQTLPALMSLKVTESVKRPESYSRYSDLAKSYAIFNNDPVNSFYTTEMQLHDLSKSWKSPISRTYEEEIEIYCDEVDDFVDLDNVTPPPSPEEKRRNIFGVEILPEIPEESEESDNEIVEDRNRKKLSDAIRRLSTLGGNFDDFIEKRIRKDSITELTDHSIEEYSQVYVTYDTIAPITEIEREKVFNSFSFRCQSAYASMRRKLWMPSYRVYRLKRRLIYTMYVINDTFVKPLTRSLSCWRFYPALLLSLARLILIGLVLAILPLVNLGMKPKISLTETNFMISLHGFTWLSFLLLTPWLAQTPKRNFKYIVLIGLLISNAACYLIAEASNHDMFSIGCVVGGLGFGAVTSSWEPAVQDFVGAHKWSKLHSPLETLSGLCLAAFIFGLSFFVTLDGEGDLNFCMLIASCALTVVSAVWFVIAIASLYVNKTRSFRLNKNWLL